LYLLGDSLTDEGRPDEAIVAFRRVSVDLYRLCGLARAEYALGHGKESQRALDELIAKFGSSENGGATAVAYVYALRGDKDKTIEWLERAYQQRDDDLISIKHVPTLQGMQSDARFQALLRKMKFPE